MRSQEYIVLYYTMIDAFSRRLAMAGLVLVAGVAPVFADMDAPAGSVICRTNRTLVQSDGAWTLATAATTMPGGITISTNGTFRVNDGKTRLLQDGQVLRPDGNLLSPDGTIVPVIDHIAMAGSNVMVFRDGDGQPLTETFTLPDGSAINPDGSYTRSTERRSRLVDGQMVTLDGALIPGLDTIRFSNGKATVYKSGTLITLQAPNVIMGMYDGTRVSSDGLVTLPDGSIEQLTEGQIITVGGVRPDW